MSADGVATLVTDSAEATGAVAATVASFCEPGDVILLVGDLGAGKTAFAQGFGRALGITEAITSPTFTLVRTYALEPGPPTGADGGVSTLFHADVYRLDHLHEIADLGLGQLVEDGGVALVEWGDRARLVLGENFLSVHLVAGGDDETRRTITIEPHGVRWPARWEALVAALGRSGAEG